MPDARLADVARSLEPLIRRHEDELERTRRGGLPGGPRIDLTSTVIMPPHPQGS